MTYPPPGTPHGPDNPQGPGNSGPMGPHHTPNFPPPQHAPLYGGQQPPYPGPTPPGPAPQHGGPPQWQPGPPPHPPGPDRSGLKVILWTAFGLVAALGLMFGGYVLFVYEEPPPPTGIKSWRIAADRFIEAVHEGNEAKALAVVCPMYRSDDRTTDAEAGVADLVHGKAQLSRANDFNRDSIWYRPGWSYPVPIAGRTTDGTLAPDSELVLDDGSGKGWCVKSVELEYGN